MWKPLIIGTILALIIIFFLNSMMNSALAETNTVSSTVVTSTPSTANAPSVVVNNSDVCKVATSGALQSQVFGIASGVVVDDPLCQILKLSKILMASGLKVAAVTLLANEEPRVWDALYDAGTFAPVDGGKIGNEAKEFWLANPELIPDGSKIKKRLLKEKEVVKEKEATIRDINDFEKFVIVGMAMYIGLPILF